MPTPRDILASLLIGAARLYQLLLSPILPRSCRFDPSCSEYFIQAVRKYGPVRGVWRGTKRICRCHPWNQGGWDPP
ncbi:MAG: membrane protein insertion efficiency factor YidD [Gemmataceae bacterium]